MKKTDDYDYGSIFILLYLMDLYGMENVNIMLKHVQRMMHLATMLSL